VEQPVRERLRAAFAWRGREEEADVSGWWADASLLRELGPALANLHREGDPTLVAGIESYGFLLGPLVATDLGVGFIEIRKSGSAEHKSDGVVSRITPPDYLERDLTLSLRHGRLPGNHRVLLVDEWVATGAQATAAKRLVDDAGSEFLGMSVIVDATDNRVRRELNLRSLLTLQGHRLR
jgi:adenine phosphoribosyltransferase